MKTLLLTLALVASAAGSALAAPTELTCEIKDRSMYFREDYYFQADGSAWVILSTRASDSEKMTKTCASQSLRVERDANTLKFEGKVLCGKISRRHHWRTVDLRTMEIRGVYAEKAHCKWLN